MAGRDEIARCCREQGLDLIATALSEEAVDLRAVPLDHAAVIIGSEGRGICREFLDLSRKQVIIPMNPRCESLNAAVAATIVMWQMKR